MGLSDWFKKITSGAKSRATSDHPDCNALLELMIDGDPTPEQQEYFRKHMKDCFPCAKSYEWDTTIREMLRSRCNGHPVPEELVQSIRVKIGQQAAR
jgi:mycothiol system anti-sigma-R factor